MYRVTQQASNGNQSKLQQHKDKAKDPKTKRKQPDQEEEGDQDYGDENNDDHWFSDSSTSDTEGEEREPRLIMYAAFTQYEVVKEVGKAVFNYHLTKDDQKDWDIAWFDGAISIKLLQKMWPHQRTNHFPGMYNLARKNCLGRHLMRMQKWLPEDYDFFPQTYMCPTDYKEFKAQITAKRNKTFIVKPEASCQGKGIFLTRNFEDLDPQEHYVVQRYMHKPYLIDGFKFDLRIYVLLAGVNPLRIFVYKDGLARFATVPYESPAPTNLTNLFMHLTNYAINKESADFVQNTDENADDVGSKRSFTSVLKRIAEEFDEDRAQVVFTQICDLIIKTMCIAQPYLQHLYKSSQPDDAENSLCCQVLGFDVMLDHNLKPQLLEVNQSPSFSTDSPLDYKIKKALITDTIKVWNLSIKRKLRAKGNKRAEMQRRLLNYQQLEKLNKDKEAKKAENAAQKDENDKPEGQSAQKEKDEATKREPPKPILRQIKSPKGENEKRQLIKQQQLEERELQRKKKMLQREKAERELCGDFVLVYPPVTYEEEFKVLEAQDPKNVGREDLQVIAAKIMETPEWEQQQKYLMFMEKAKNLWESFTQGNAINKKKKEQEQKEKEEQAKKEQQKKKALLVQKMKRDQEERKAKQEEMRKQQMDQYMLQQRQYLEMTGQTTPSQQDQISMDERQDPKRYMHTNQNHLPYRTNSQGQGTRNAFTYEMQSKSGILMLNGQQFEFPAKVTLQPDTQFPQHQFRNAKTQSNDGTNDQGFYLPQVDKQQQQYNVKRAIHEDYEKHNHKYNQLIKYYNYQNDDNSLPAVPALGNQLSIGEQIKRKGQPSREIFLIENPQQLVKPPLKNSQHYKREDSDASSRIQNKKQSNPLPNQRLNDLLQFSQHYVQQQPQQNLAMKLETNFKASKLQSDTNINGVNHYLKQEHMIRSMSLDKKELPHIAKTNFSQVSTRVATEKASSTHGKKSPAKQKSEVFGEAISLGIVGEKKKLISQQNDIQSVSSGAKRNTKVVKIKESKKPSLGYGYQNVVNPHELYKLLN